MKSYKLETGKLYYIDTKYNGTSFNQLVLKKNETERVFEYYLTAGGHKDRDATIANIKDGIIGLIIIKKRSVL